MAKKKKKNLKLRKRLIMVAWFLIIFNILAIPLYIVMYFNLSYPPLQNFLAAASEPAIKLFGYQTSLVYSPYCNAKSISLPEFGKEICISWDSTGWKSMYALAALGIATPFIAWRKKLKFIAIWVPAVFVINYLRIVTTILIALRFGFQYFNVVHTILWREGLILLIVAIWSVWIWKNWKRRI
jgi:exosortase/archaeosortase family protein